MDQETDKNVYIIGAGFSKELGLPLQNDFLQCAREIYFTDTGKYDHFKRVFEYRDELSKLRNYLSIDLLNLESLFNLLEMHVFYSDSPKYKGLRDDYVELIRDVLVAKMLPVVKYTKIPGGEDPSVPNQFRNYLTFLELFIAVNPLGDGKSFDIRHDTIISLNYDLVIESAVALFNFFTTEYGRGKYRHTLAVREQFGKENILFESPGDYLQPVHARRFLFEGVNLISEDSPLKLIKLHGSINWKVDDKTFIIPPSWNKSDPRVRLLWEEAYKELQKAKRIIVIGYSFPETDIYIKNLLALAINENQHLQTIVFVNPDVGETRRKSLSFIDEHFSKYCHYKEWKFNDFVNTKEGRAFVKEQLNRSISAWGAQ